MIDHRNKSRSSGLSSQDVDAIHALAGRAAKVLHLSDADLAALNRVAKGLITLSSALAVNDDLADHFLYNIIEHARGAIKAETVSLSRKPLKRIRIFGRYEVRFIGAVRGPKTFTVRSGHASKGIRIAVNNNVPSSRSKSLLLGEFFQDTLRKLLRRLIVGGRSVQSVCPLRVATKGRRVDDWELTLSNGERVPVETKCSTSISYFDKAVGQIEAALRKSPQVIFVGVLYGSKRILVAHFKKGAFSRNDFRAARAAI